MDVLITGMSQLQQVLLKQKSDVLDLEPKAVAELVKLFEYTAETGAIDFQDYLYLAEQQIGWGAGEWWAKTLKVAQTAYAEYQTLSPVSANPRAEGGEVQEAGAEGRSTGAGLTPKGGERRPGGLPGAGCTPDPVPAHGDLAAWWSSGQGSASEAVGRHRVVSRPGRSHSLHP